MSEGAVEEATAPPLAPWGIGTALAALLISLVCGTMGPVLPALVARSYFAAHTLLFEVVAYQFLTVGVGISAISLVVSRYRDGGALLGFRIPNGERLAGIVLASIVVAAGGASLIQLIFNTFLPGYHLQGNSSQVFPTSPAHFGLLSKVLLALWIAVEVPLTEETLFRGILFQGLERAVWGKVPAWSATLIAAIASGVIFGIVHFEIHTLPILIFLGIVLAYAFHFTRSVYASALLHGLVNFAALITVLGV